MVLTPHPTIYYFTRAHTSPRPHPASTTASCGPASPLHHCLLLSPNPFLQPPLAKTLIYQGRTILAHSRSDYFDADDQRPPSSPMPTISVRYHSSSSNSLDGKEGKTVIR
ncbi:hypothetical protein RHMOL_Rhmol09G0077300 [Rhododendron molle]|uniref:Uncharacterized protein n=1 Tax=Rhododendron molle TaxID=49168 RepID=A0ACC0MC37_RHOML|nr:hypothetical protein RHMOL_Rhmol09G0077300 [Rhododendron molle]